MTRERPAGRGAGTRTTQQYLADSRRALVGWSDGFDAPELRTMGNSPATDMFALGRTVATLREECADGGSGGGASLGEVDAFVAALTAAAAAARPRADAAARHAFFRPLVEHLPSSALPISSRTKCTRLVPPSVLSVHVSSLLPY